MADEISVSTRLYARNGFLLVDHNVGTIAVDMSGTTYASGAVEYSTTAAGTAISLDGVTTGTMGYAFFRNLDATNYIEIGVQVLGTFYAFTKLLAGEVAIVRMNQSNAPYARANTASVRLAYSILAA